MRCPFCSSEDSKVVDSRSTEDNLAIRRRRECLSCNKRYTTYEKIEEMPILVIKRGQHREFFNREKLIRGIVTACQKRPVTRAIIEDIANDIEKSLNNKMMVEIKSEELGEMVLEKLKYIDEVAYVRFASVYRQFDDIDTFIQEIDKLRNLK
ncbi:MULTISPECIES: transcriptional regulator NrdR [Clostridium]|uniref:Transcriptional repressor NrdR n=1 Tax=Clostridium senegalense TaxID=1465809 RepID=A0A6M0GZ17_9CLOT|nr:MULTISPECIES: transcriptional regulator NrdR [Clostridium]MBU5225634.1 transcriptional regulator NrdR [Clostridium senegalense]NEU03826.1 transcriptional repressor NrdR [Clostridium senegalense]